MKTGTSKDERLQMFVRKRVELLICTINNKKQTKRNKNKLNITCLKYDVLSN